MLLAVSMPADNDRGPPYAEQLFNALHAGNRYQPITLHYASRKKSHALYVRCSNRLARLVRHQLQAAFPSATVEQRDDASLTPSAEQRVFTADLRLRPDLFPIRRFGEFDDMLTRERVDPLASVLSSLESHVAGMTVRIDLTVKPIPTLFRYWYRHSILLLHMPWLRRNNLLYDRFAYGLSHRSPLIRILTWVTLVCLPGKRARDEAEGATNRDHQRETDLSGALDKVGRHLYHAQLRLFVFAGLHQRCQAEQKLAEVAAAFSPFVVPRRSRFELGPMHCAAGWPISRSRPKWLASSEELASLWHPATCSVSCANMETAACRPLEPPAELPRQREEGMAILGRTNTLGRQEEFGLRLDDRRRHLAIVGKTGMGKSTLLQNLITADVARNLGVVLIDPHGDLAEQTVSMIPSCRTGDVVYFDAGDREFPVAFNPLGHQDPGQRALVAAGVLAAFKKLFADSWGPRLEHILRNALLALLETRGTTLISLQRMLFDASFCKGIVNRVSDPAVAAFWRMEWRSWRDAYRNEAIAPVVNKLGHFLSNPILRSILGQQRNRIDLRQIIDNEQVLIANLSKGRIGEDASNLLGSLLIASLQLAAMGRADCVEQERRDCFLYVDEFQNFATDSFAAILSEARKYRLNLTIANQYLEQIDQDVLAAVFGNVGSLLSFQVGPRDAEVLSEQFGGYVSKRDLIQLPKYHAYVRLLVDGGSARPFSMTTLPPSHSKTSRSGIVRRQSRQRYAQSVDAVNKEVKRQFAMGGEGEVE